RRDRTSGDIPVGCHSMAHKGSDGSTWHLESRYRGDEKTMAWELSHPRNNRSPIPIREDNGSPGRIILHNTVGYNIQSKNC
ncbi:MAG: hypothetical protein V5A79_08085, partial [Candidatus Bipolaricaulota bacterium]